MSTKVTIAVPTNRQGMRPKMVQSLTNLLARGGYDFHIVIAEEGYTIAENRNYMAVQAVRNGSEYILMIDDDMTFKPDLLDRLMSNNREICGVAYVPRTDTGRVFKYIDETHHVFLEETDDPKYKDTFECHYIGTGIVLIKTEVFLKIPQPWFAFEYHDNGACKKGEDYYFCDRAREHGYKVYTDPIPYVGHLGEKEFTSNIHK